MRRLVLSASLVLVFTSVVAAQGDDYRKWEFFGGYSSLYFDNLAGDTGNPNIDDIRVAGIYREVIKIQT